MGVGKASGSQLQDKQDVARGGREGALSFLKKGKGSDFGSHSPSTLLGTHIRSSIPVDDRNK